MIYSIVRSVDGGVASEVEFVDEEGQMVGYWAYGHFNPSLPYHGQFNYKVLYKETDIGFRANK